MKAMITGVTGFAGSHLAERLLDCGDEVIGISSRGQWRAAPSTQRVPGPAELEGRVELLSWPLPDPPDEKLTARISEFAPDVIYHLAAISVPGDCGDAEPTPRAWQVNVQGAKAIIELAASLRTQRVPGPRLVYISSCRVYAPVDSSQPVVSEDSPVGPAQAYGKTKLAAEKLALAEDRIESVVVRAFNHAGPRQDARLMLSEWARQLVSGQDPVRVRRLNSYLDLSDVRDVVRAYHLLAQSGRAGSVYNVGQGAPRRSGDIFRELCRICGAAPQVEEMTAQPQYEPIADITRVKNDAGWRPEIPLTKTLKDTLDYWRKEANGMRDLLT